MTKIPDFMDGTAPMYPPLFTYQSAVLCKIGAQRLSVIRTDFPAVADTWERVRFKLLAIAYHMLAGLIVLLALSRWLPPPWPLVGTGVYLFHPGVFINSAWWGQVDAIHTFFVLASVLCLAMAFQSGRNAWLFSVRLAFALAICSKLQSIMISPLLVVTAILWCRPRTIVWMVILFLSVLVALYSPFVLAHQWEYFDRVFGHSSSFFPLLQVNAFNLWALGFNAQATDKALPGLTYARIGQILYLALALWGACVLATRCDSEKPISDAPRRLFITGAFFCLAAFLVLTSMHSRHIAPAIPLVLVAAFLDPRLRALACGFSATYALLNLGMFSWLVARLPRLLSGPDSPQPTA